MKKKLSLVTVAFFSFSGKSVYADTSNVLVQYRAEASQMVLSELEYKDALAELLPHTGESHSASTLVLGVIFLVIAALLLYGRLGKNEI